VTRVGTIDCPCQGSRFPIEDGSVVQAAAGHTSHQQPALPACALGSTATPPGWRDRRSAAEFLQQLPTGAVMPVTEETEE